MSFRCSLQPSRFEFKYIADEQCAAEMAKSNDWREAGMLVLSRKKNEQIVIDENVVVTIVQIRGDKVRVGIEAPKDVPVHRKEVHEAMKLNPKKTS